MRIFFMLLVVGLAAWAQPVQAQTAPRMIQCEDCTPPQMRSLAASRRQGGAFYVFSLKSGLVLRYWVEYDSRDSMRWMATPIEVENGVVNMYAHMLNAYEIKKNVFVGQQVFRGRLGHIGGGHHDPVAVSIKGQHDDAYGRFIFNARSCLATAACAGKISTALAQLNLAEQKARSLNFTLFRGFAGGMAWQDTPPNVTVHLCNDNNDCAILKYQNGEWVYIETRAEGGTGKRYPKYREDLDYSFGNSGEAGVFQRGLTGAGATVIGTWRVRSMLACTSVGGNARCEYVDVIVP